MPAHSLFLIGALFAASATSAPAADLAWEPHTFVSARRESVAAERATLRVPENRTKPGSRTIELALVRFRCTGTNPGAPIVYLAGGPGGSGIEAARGSRFPLFMAMRELGDVIALDQRGTGHSQPALACDEPVTLPTDRPLDRRVLAEAMRGPVEACAARWRAEGVDIAAYNTNENADDLESLRAALGAPRLRLWAISYGTHLALAAIRRHPGSVESAILAGVEGPDHTLKLPGNTERLLEEMAKRAARDSTAGAGKDLVGTLRGVLAALEREPARVRIPDDRTPEPGDSLELVLGREEAARMFAELLGAAEAQPYFAAFVGAAARGDFAMLGRLDLARVRPRRPPSAMSFAMDCASGASEARMRRIEREAAQTTLGDATNPWEADLCGVWNVPDLGAGFRAPVRSEVPVLFISGTLDLNTPPSNAEEVRAGFSRGSHLVIDGVAHSDPLFLSSPRIRTVMLDFFAGRPVARDERIEVPFRFRGDLGELARALR